MKSSQSPVWVIPILCLFISSCAKDPQINTNNKPVLEFSNTSVKIGQAVYVTTSSISSGTTVKWSTGTNGQIWSSGDTATLLFTGPGTYTVKALYTTGSGTVAYDSSIGYVTVVDSLYTDTATMHCNVVGQITLFPNDQVNLTPISYSDTGLIFIAHTQLPYSFSPILDCGGNHPLTAGVLECDFNSTLVFPCIGSNVPTPAVGIVSFTSLTTGTFNLEFKLNGNLYQGSVNVSSTQCVISWTDTSGVTISPLVIQKQ